MVGSWVVRSPTAGREEAPEPCSGAGRRQRQVSAGADPASWSAEQVAHHEPTGSGAPPAITWHDDRAHLVDLSHDIEHGTVTYPGLPAPEISSHLDFDASRGHYAAGTEFAIGRITMVANTGTYLDTPAHRYRDGHDLGQLPLERCANLPAVVVDGTGPLGPEAFAGVEIAGRAVLLRTGWDQHWGTERYACPEHPHLSESGARHLVSPGAVLVGIDSVNSDSVNSDNTRTGQRPAHTHLLAAGIPVVEHLTGLDALPAAGFRFTAAPPAIRGLATFPVRAFAVVG
jgi:kynurenine formamidase